VREQASGRAGSLAFASLASPLSRCQAQAVIDRLQLRARSLACQLELLNSPQSEAQRAREAFVATSRVEVGFLLEALAAGRARCLVLEAADVLAAGLGDAVIACVPDRGAPFDAFLNRAGRIMDEMEPRSRIGVMSQRVRAQLQHLWPDLRFEILRGGVDRAMETHLRQSEIDGLVLPASVTEQLGIQGIVAEIFAPEFVLPGPGQGTLVVVSREGDDEVRELLAPLHSEDSARELTAESAFHARMLPDQDLPVGALARVDGTAVEIVGCTGTGRRHVAAAGAATEAAAVGGELALRLLSHRDSLADLLEGDFPDGLPDEPDEDAELLGNLGDGDDEPRGAGVAGFDDLDDLGGYEDLGAFEDIADDPDADPDDDPDGDDSDPGDLDDDERGGRRR
jgi:hydroxymethylbilane synthase